MFDKKIYAARRAKLRQSLKGGLVFFPGNPEVPCNYAGNTYPFRQDSNFLYFFGLQKPDMYGVIDLDADKDYLYADDLTMDDIIWMGHLPSVADMAAEVGIADTAPVEELRNLLHKAALSRRRVHFVAPYNMQIAQKMSEWLSIPVAKLKDSQSVELIKAISDQRSIKGKEELAEIEIFKSISARLAGAEFACGFPVFTVLVVFSPFFRIIQHIVCFIKSLELGFGLWIIRVKVRMELLSSFTISGLDVFLRGIFGNPHNLVVINKCHNSISFLIFLPQIRCQSVCCRNLYCYFCR